MRPRLWLRLPVDHDPGRLIHEYVEHEPDVGQRAVKQRLTQVRKDSLPPPTHLGPGVGWVEAVVGKVVAERHVVVLERRGVEEHELARLARLGDERVCEGAERATECRYVFLLDREL